MITIYRLCIKIVIYLLKFIFQNVFRQRLGSRIPSTRRYFDALLDRSTFTRALAMAGQSVDADGISSQRHQFRVVKHVSEYFN